MNKIHLLKNINGNATNMVSLLISANSNPTIYSKKITKEISAASNIKDKINRDKVITSLSWIKDKLKNSHDLPTGCALYAGWYI